MNCVDRIEADSIIVEIIDKNTGRTYRRNLPVSYFETANVVVLSGESIEGSPAQIAFYSAEALARINELVGKGADAPRCDEK